MLLGEIIIIFGLAIFIFNIKITGAVIGSLGFSSLGIIALAIFIGGFILINMARKESGLIERVKEISPVVEHKILVSKKAMARLRKDKRIQENTGKYGDIMRMIASAPKSYQQESLGDFQVSPRGHNPLRVAWHFNKDSGKVYIDDFLYHTKGDKYNDNWNKKVAKGSITLKDYKDSGYFAFT